MSLKMSRFGTTYNLSFFSYYSVTLNWSPPINRGGVELTGYVIEKRLSTTHKWEKAATVDASVTLYTIENLKEKSEYYFRVSAENEEGAGEPAATEKVALRTSARKYNTTTLPWCSLYSAQWVWIVPMREKVHFC